MLGITLGLLIALFMIGLVLYGVAKLAGVGGWFFDTLGSVFGGFFWVIALPFKVVGGIFGHVGKFFMVGLVVVGFVVLMGVLTS